MADDSGPKIRLLSKQPLGVWNGFVDPDVHLAMSKEGQADRIYVTVCYFTVPKFEVNNDTSERTPVVQMLRAEVLMDEHAAKQAGELLQRAWARRSDQQQLPYDAGPDMLRDGWEQSVREE